MGIIETIATTCTVLVTNWPNIVIVFSAIYGGLTAIVKWTPTLKDDNFFLGLIKLLGKITNRTVDDKAVRTSMAK
jgi:hypothetical protein